MRSRFFELWSGVEPVAPIFRNRKLRVEAIASGLLCAEGDDKLVFSTEMDQPCYAITGADGWEFLAQPEVRA
jgi:hypothetical protein